MFFVCKDFSVKIPDLRYHAKNDEMRSNCGRFIEILTPTQMKPKQPVLDRLDWRILESLQTNARMTNTELGKQVGLSQPAVTARIRRLEDVGVIEGYAARINPGLAGLHTAALIRIRTTHAQIKQCLKAFEAMPEVIEAHRITGEDCFVVRVVVEQMSQLEHAIDSLAKFGAVTTAVVLASYPPKVVRAP